MSIGGEIVYGHYIAKLEVLLSLLFQNKVSKGLEGYFDDNLINVCKNVQNIICYNKSYHDKRGDMKEQSFLVKARFKPTQHFVKGFPVLCFDANQKLVACDESKDYCTCEAESLQAITETTRKNIRRRP
eukprot:8829360-Ditylum_brightwellii.AAC.2